MNTPVPTNVQLKELVHDVLEPMVAAIDLDGVYPGDVLRRLGAIGGFGALVDRRYGGTERGLADAIRTIETVSHVCVTTGSLAWSQATCALYLMRGTNHFLRDQLLPAIVRGEQMAGTGLSNTMKSLCAIEPMQLTARRASGGYIVNGTLSRVSNMAEEHYALVGTEAPGGRAVLLVHGSTPGVRLSRAAESLGLEGSLTVAMHFSDVFVADAFVIAQPADGFLRMIALPMILAQVGLGLGLVGACVEEDADLADALSSLRAETYAIAERCENGTATRREVFAAHAASSELALRAANSALLQAGAKGYLTRHPAQRRLREAYFIAIMTPAFKHLREELTRSA